MKPKSEYNLSLRTRDYLCLRINENLVSCRYTLCAPSVHCIWSVHHVLMLQTPSTSLVPRTCQVYLYYRRHKTLILVHQAYTACCIHHVSQSYLYLFLLVHIHVNQVESSASNRFLCTQRLVYQAYRPRTMDTRLLNYSCLHVKSCVNAWTHFYDLFKHLIDNWHKWDW